MPATEERVDRLEIALESFIRNVGIEFNKAYNSNEEFKLEMKEFKLEMKEFKDEMKEFKNEMKEFKNEMKTEMKEFKAEMKDSIKDLNKKFGDMSRKLGTIVEDLVLPSMPRIIKEKFGFELEAFFINSKFKKNGRNQEYDAIGLYQNYVFLNSTKTTLREKDIVDFKLLRDDLLFWFPEHKGKKIIGVLAAFDISENVLIACEKEGLMVMGAGGDLMELRNREDFRPLEFIL